MTNIGKWNTPTGGASTPTTILSISSLATNTMSSASSTVRNDTGLDLYVDVEVFLAALSPVAPAYVALYILESVDGTNFPAQSDADLRLTTTQLLVVIPVGTTASTAQRVVARNVLIPPGQFQIKLDNQTGASLVATSTVKFLTYSYYLNG